MAKNKHYKKKPSKPKKGDTYEVKHKHGKTTMKYTGKKGFGAWKIIANKKK